MCSVAGDKARLRLAELRYVPRYVVVSGFKLGNSTKNVSRYEICLFISPDMDRHRAHMFHDMSVTLNNLN
jgi:hypothetical protein